MFSPEHFCPNHQRFARKIQNFLWLGGLQPPPPGPYAYGWYSVSNSTPCKTNNMPAKPRAKNIFYTIFINLMTNSMSRQDNPNSALWMARRGYLYLATLDNQLTHNPGDSYAMNKTTDWDVMDANKHVQKRILTNMQPSWPNKLSIFHVYYETNFIATVFTHVYDWQVLVNCTCT